MKKRFRYVKLTDQLLFKATFPKMDQQEASG